MSCAIKKCRTCENRLKACDMINGQCQKCHNAENNNTAVQQLQQPKGALSEVTVYNTIPSEEQAQ